MKPERLGWPVVLGCLSEPETRQRAITQFRAAGFTPDQFAAKQSARAAAVDALVSAEDWLELGHASPRRMAERSAIRDVRRRLELELWP